MLVGNDKAFFVEIILSKEKLSLKYRTSLRALSGGKRQAHACRPLSFFIGMVIHKITVDRTFTLRLSEKTTNACRKRQVLVVSDKPIFCLELV